MTMDRILPAGGLGPKAGTDTTTAGGRGMSAPERIWAFDYDLQEDDGTWRNWQCWSPDHPAPIIATEYIRADLLTDAKGEIARLQANHSRFPEAMAAVETAKAMQLPDRIAGLCVAMSEVPKEYWGYQWVADERPAFGEKYVRHVSGDNGQGMGRQWLATTPSHVPGLARYIAAANPDTASMLVAAITNLQTLLARVLVMDLGSAEEAAEALGGFPQVIHLVETHHAAHPRPGHPTTSPDPDEVEF